jgi:dTDP-4-dehydro-6-deoxy-alpha-D-gulose 4-ketoreductase
MEPGVSGGDRHDWCGREVLVTGGRGFIGAHFVEELAAGGARVVSLHRDATAPDTGTGPIRELGVDLLSAADTAAALRGLSSGVDMLVHCAGVTGNTEYRAHHFGSTLDENLRINLNVLNAARDSAIPLVVMLSTTDVYPDGTDGPVREEDGYQARLRLPGDGYRLSKVFAEILADAYRSHFGMRIQLVRSTNVYGPGDGIRGGSLRAIPAMMHRIATGQPIEVWGDGRQRRSFIYVNDLVRAVLQIAARGRHDTVNVATGTSISLLTLARLLTREFGVAERLALRPDMPTGAWSREVNIDRMREIIDFDPRPIEEGIRETVRWYQRTRAPAPVPALAWPTPEAQ